MSNRHLRYPVVLSILAALATLGLKTTAYLMTGSVGLLSDALESGINLLAALLAYLSLWYSSRPVDASHTYGHEKIEFFSSGLEGGLIVVAALGIARAAVLRLLAPAPLESLGLGTAVALAASLINFAVARLLLSVGRRHQSIILEADGHHLMTDVWTSVAVVAGLGLVAATGLHWIDPVIALLVAVHILWTAFGLLRRSFNGLMDRSLPEDELAALRAAIRGQLAEGTTFHALRTRRAGARRFADCHLLVPGDWSVGRAHELAERIERAAREAIPGLEATLHVEPIEERASYEDSALLALEPAPPDGGGQ